MDDTSDVDEDIQAFQNPSSQMSSRRAVQSGLLQRWTYVTISLRASQNLMCCHSPSAASKTINRKCRSAGTLVEATVIRPAE
jgi:hypothetical protein